MLTGKPFENGIKTEVIDLLDPNNHCITIDFPKPIMGPSTGLLGTKLPMICGGRHENGDLQSQCYILHSRKFKPSFNLLDALGGALGSVVINASLFTVGGTILDEHTSKFVETSFFNGIIEHEEVPYGPVWCKILIHSFLNIFQSISSQYVSGLHNQY